MFDFEVPEEMTGRKIEIKNALLRIPDEARFLYVTQSNEGTLIYNHNSNGEHVLTQRLNGIIEYDDVMSALSKVCRTNSLFKHGA